MLTISKIPNINDDDILEVKSSIMSFISNKYQYSYYNLTTSMHYLSPDGSKSNLLNTVSYCWRKMTQNDWDTVNNHYLPLLIKQGG